MSINVLKALSPIRILLYVVVTRAHADTPVVRHGARLWRNRARRVFELAKWRLFRRWRAHYSAFEDVTHSNRGDAAIREGLRQELARGFAPCPVTFIEAAWGELAAGLAQNVDLVVLGGSGFIHPDDHGRLPARFTRDLEILEKTSVPVIAVSIGLNSAIRATAASGPAFADDQGVLLRRLFSRLALASVRDQNSSDALSVAAGGAPAVVIDPAFLLGAELGPRMERTGGTQPLAVGLNIAFHSDFPSKLTHTFLPTVVRALKAFAAKRPCRFVYFVHSDGERAIASALHLAGIELEVVHGTVDEMLAAYRTLDIHVAQMLHSAILSMSVGVPTLALPYDVKSAAFFKLFGLEDFCIDSPGLGGGEIAAAFEMLLARRAFVRMTLATTAPNLVTRAREFYRQASRVIVEEKQPTYAA